MTIYSLKALLLKVYNSHLCSRNYKRYARRTVIKKLTPQQRKEAEDYYQQEFGIKINPRFHEILYSMSGTFKKEYMPIEVYNTLIRTLSPWKYKKILDDKVLYDWLLPNVTLPKRILSCCNGVSYKYNSRDKQEVNYAWLLHEASFLSDVIIKPSINSSAGIGVKCISTNDGKVIGSGETVEDILKSYRGNFVIEKRIINNENLKCLNPSSCNTLRVHTWRDRENGKIQFVSSFLRVGHSGAVVDNGFAGGIAVPINSNDGVCSNSGCHLNNYRRIEKTDTGIVLKGYPIEQFHEIVEVAKRGHSNLPYFDFIGWDITVDEDGNVIVVEFNPDPDMRLDQLIFMDTCLLEHQKKILSAVYRR